MVTQDIPEGYKRCSSCGEVLELESSFSRNKHRKDGFRSNCKKCAQLEYRQWREQNIETARESTRRWRMNNHESAKEKLRTYYHEHTAEAKQRNKRWEENNRERRRYLNKQAHYRKRAARNNLLYSVPRNIVEVLSRQQLGKCIYCQCNLESVRQELEHIVPLSLAQYFKTGHPGHTPPNLALACQHCNASKHNAILEDWLTWKYPDQMDEVLHRVDRHIALLTELWERYGEDEELWIRALGLPQPHAL